MSGKVFFILLSFLLILSFRPPGPPSLQDIISAYSRTDRLYNASDYSIATDSVCIKGFSEVIVALGNLDRSRTVDSLLCLSLYKLGILCEVNKDFSKASAAYLRALNYVSEPEDRFRMLIFTGAAYYNLNNFDSAYYFLLRAAETKEDIGFSEDRIRLYNTLGVLFYDNGNYLQSRNYFTQALRIIEKTNPTDLRSTYSVELNMATCYYKLGQYEQALSLYKKVMGYQLLSDPLYLNMGRAYAGLRQYKDALSSFRKVKIKTMPGVLNEMARIALESGNGDSAALWLELYRSKKKLFHTNHLDDGINELYSGDLEIYYGRPETALSHLQEALIIFSGNFANRDIRKNPYSFTGSFAYYRLFEVLTKKSAAWEIAYRKSRRPEDLKAAYDSYQSTISLLSYIENSYEMDDAKILLKQKSDGVYKGAMEVCLQLNKIYPEAGFLEAAFLISEKDKASVMSSQIRERNFLVSAGPEKELESEERNIRFNIARLISVAEGSLDAGAIQKINDEKSSYESRLVNLHRKMEMNSRFYNLRYSDDFPSIKTLQGSMNPGQALISFFNTGEKIEIFVLTKSSLKHMELDSGETIRKNIQAWIQILQNAEGGRHIKSSGLKEFLFNHLMKPVIDLAGDMEEWIIVPDGIFFLLPIESLPADGGGGLIIEKHVVSYEFSSRFLMHRNSQFRDRGFEKQVISFAPFSDRGAKLQPADVSLEKLPFSKYEISGLSGYRYSDQLATKRVFLKNLNRFQVIHLATHAITDLDNPSASYIAFYPATGNRPEDFLFLDEIYSLRMDSCQMVVISACETGRGELVHNEGVMSFARAFLYAGCPSTINTLWKADDHTTSEIVRLFYKYLDAGESKSRALRKAKLEFLDHNPVYRDPAYWSHIILTGNPEALSKKKQPWIWAVLAISCGTIIFFTIRKRKEKKVDAFHS